jgi:hypothetical protein
VFAVALAVMVSITLAIILLTMNSLALAVLHVVKMRALFGSYFAISVGSVFGGRFKSEVQQLDCSYMDSPTSARYWLIFWLRGGAPAAQISCI